MKGHQLRGLMLNQIRVSLQTFYSDSFQENILKVLLLNFY